MPYAIGRRLLLLATVGSLFCVTSCGRKQGAATTGDNAEIHEETTASSSEDSKEASPGQPAQRPAMRGGAQPGIRAAIPTEIWREFSGDKAFALVEQQVAIGPRPAGSAEAKTARGKIVQSLKESGWNTAEQAFSAETPVGKVAFVNLIARFSPAQGKAPATSTQRVIVCSHYDTKRFSTIRFVGASDGASSTGALLELARVLAMDPALAAKVELVFFDGEEAVREFTETDGLYGSRFYAKNLADEGRVRQFKYAILWDMIGDKDLTITLPPNTPPELARGIFDSAEVLKLRQHFRFFSQSLLDDHVPLSRRGIPAIDLIDFDYLPWHTADDTIDKLSPESLRKVGAVTLHYLSRTLQREP